MKTKVHHHSSMAIIESDKTRDFLFDIYDNTFPIVANRGKAHFIGGNHNLEDDSPFSIFDREIREEFSGYEHSEKEDNTLLEVIGAMSKEKEIKNFASKEFIHSIRDSIIGRAEPFQDFLITVPSIESRPASSGIHSIYRSLIPQEIFDKIEEELSIGRSIKCEGLSGIASKYDILSGNVLLTNGNSGAMQYYLQSIGLLDIKELDRKPHPLECGSSLSTREFLSEILCAEKSIKDFSCIQKTHQSFFNLIVPNPMQILASPIGLPRPSMKGYLIDFEYVIPIKAQ